MYILCGGCGQIIAEQDIADVVMKHRGRVVSIREGSLICECGTTTGVRAGRPVPAADEPYREIRFAGRPLGSIVT